MRIEMIKLFQSFSLIDYQTLYRFTLAHVGCRFGPLTIDEQDLNVWESHRVIWIFSRLSEEWHASAAFHTDQYIAFWPNGNLRPHYSRLPISQKVIFPEEPRETGLRTEFELD